MDYKFALREDLKDNKKFLPTKAHDTDTGYDVCAAQEDRKSLIIKPFDYIKIPLGFRAFCPEGYWLELKPRSSTFTKKSLHALYGTVDQTFEGEMIFACQYVPPILTTGPTGRSYRYLWELYYTEQELTINFGDAIGQLIPIKRQDMNVLETTNEEYEALCKARNAQRGAGGFGSSDGKKLK